MVPISFKRLFYVVAIAALSLGGVLLLAQPAGADPSLSVSPASPSAPPGPILDAAPGGPIYSPLPPPPPLIPLGALGLPPASNIDALSYGDDVYPAPAPWHVAFSVAMGSAGHPGSPPLPVFPNVFFETMAGDGSVAADVFSSFDMTLTTTPLGAYAAAFPPAPCGPILSNLQIADEDGAGPFAFGTPNVGLGLAPGLDDVDAVEMLDNSFVDFIPPGGDLIPDAPVFFSVDAATAAILPPLPPGFGANTAADVLVWDPGTATLYNWAPAPVLGLVPGDDIDALAVGYISGAAIPGGFAGFPDSVSFSLAPGSPSLGVLGSICYGPGTGTAGDIFVMLGAPPVSIVDAEMMGLNTFRSGGGADDDLDAIDFVLASGATGDGDVIDDALDMDDDNDGLGDTPDVLAGCSPVMADTDGDGLSDYDEVIVYATNCALVDSDGEGCPDGVELQTAAGSEVSGGLRNPINPYDYFNPTNDGENRIDDVLAVIGRYFTDGDPTDPINQIPPAAPAYHAKFDREPLGPDQWDLTQGNGEIRIGDILAIIYQYFHDCGGGIPKVP
jgi:hypothetical protein